LARRSSLKRDLKRIVDSLKSLPGVKALVLYGSFARGDFGATSDVDVLIVIDSPKTRSAVLEALARLDVDRRIQPTVRSEKELASTDTGLVANIFEEGKIIYLREPVDVPVTAILSLKPYCIITFELKGLRQNVKAKFNRVMYERSSGKYKYGGLLGELGGRRLGRGCMMVLSIHSNHLKKALVIAGLVLFFGFDELVLVILFFKIGFPQLSVLTWVAIALGVVALNVSLALVVYKVIMNRPSTGVEGLVGLTGTVEVSGGKRGTVFVRGERWDAEFIGDVSAGDEVRVVYVRGLKLGVERVAAGDDTRADLRL